MKTQAAQEIKKIVDTIIKVNPGGPEFFSALDEFLRTGITPVMLKELFNLAGKNIVLSGKFGKYIAEQIDKGNLPTMSYILFNGGLREGAEPTILKMNHNLSSNLVSYVFVDDTIYGGLTYRLIKEYLLSHNVDVINCAVVYDGAPIVRKDISAVFRYYDHYQAVPNFNFFNLQEA
jgi:hypothetical protein